jgi:hypothetical protein
MSAKPTPEELTAYVLGALDAAARARVEAAVAADTNLAAEVAKLRRTAGYVAANLARDPQLRLSPDRRAALEAALRKQLAANPEPPPAWWRAALRPYVMGPLAAAALVILVVWVGGTPKATTPVAEQAERVMQAPAAAPAAPPAEAPVPAATPPAAAVAKMAPAPAPKPVRLRTGEDLRAGGSLARSPQVSVAAPEPKAEVASAPSPQLAEGYGEASGGRAANKEADVMSESAPAPAAPMPQEQSVAHSAKAAREAKTIVRTKPSAGQLVSAFLSIRAARISNDVLYVDYAISTKQAGYALIPNRATSIYSYSRGVTVDSVAHVLDESEVREANIQPKLVPIGDGENFFRYEVSLKRMKGRKGKVDLRVAVFICNTLRMANSLESAGHEGTETPYVCDSNVAPLIKLQTILSTSGEIAGSN